MSNRGINDPIRYHGYYYDSETGLYYLKSRYYDPEVGRFINADGYVSTGQGVLGHNMFAYCGNNPVMNSDPTGEFWGLVLGVFVIASTLTGCVANSKVSKPRQDLSNAPDLNVNKASPSSYNCYGNGIGKQVVANPTGYVNGDSTRQTFEAVKQDLGINNVRELTSIDDTIANDEFKVAMKCGPSDYHFIRLTSDGWYNKSGTAPGLYIDQSLVTDRIWYARWQVNGTAHLSTQVFYDDETIYFAVKKEWDKK